MKALRRSPEPILLPLGFEFGAVAADIKQSGRPDLALVRVIDGSVASAVFTRNLVVAAPVEIGRKNLESSHGRLKAVLVNSGNANCANGKAGIQACMTVCSHAARRLGVPANHVFPSSTGIIGVPLPSDKIIAHLPALIASCAPTREGAARFATAIVTTDTRPKIASRKIHVANQSVTFLGIAKGSGMIHPNLATMLVYIFTDLDATAVEIRGMLRTASDQTFNRISVDGDTSTNDTVLLLASGQSCVSARSSSLRRRVTQALHDVCKSLAEQIITDGEGVNHVIQLSIEQARTADEALQVARTIATSSLVKTAWAGADPNWGRILAAVGRSGIPIDPTKVNISIAGQTVCRRGASCNFDLRLAHRALIRPECEIRVQLGRGKERLLFLTTDLTSEYVRINADYST